MKKVIFTGAIFCLSVWSTDLPRRNYDAKVDHLDNGLFLSLEERHYFVVMTIVFFCVLLIL